LRYLNQIGFLRLKAVNIAGIVFRQITADNKNGNINEKI
jgi:hypothetical protein